MKKILTLILSVILVLTLVSCGKKATDAEVKNDPEPEQQIISEEIKPEEETVTDKKEEKTEDKKEETKKENTSSKTENKNQTAQSKPETTPEIKEEPEEAPKTVGQTLAADFKAKAGSYSSASSLAEAIASNSIIPFSAGAMPVEQGLLSGFGNTEITGFKDGAMFAPFIGSIPFVGYVFILEDGVSASSFISTLNNSADLRWNVCVEADEKVSASVGNKVFFVMSPKSFDE